MSEFDQAQYCLIQFNYYRQIDTLPMKTAEKKVEVDGKANIDVLYCRFIRFWW